MTKLVFVSLFSLTYSVVFECTFKIEDLQMMPSCYTFTATVMNASTYSVLQGIKGQHLTNKGNSDVKGLTIIEQDLSHFPKNLEKYFANLIFLYFGKTKLTTISAEDLKPFPNLIRFSSYRNPVVALNKNVFQFSRKIKYLSRNFN